MILMGVRRLREVCAELVAAGRSPSTPAAIVERASTSDQRKVLGALADLPDLADAEGIAAPATLIVGEVAALAGRLAPTLAVAAATFG